MEVEVGVGTCKADFLASYPKACCPLSVAPCLCMRLSLPDPALPPYVPGAPRSHWDCAAAPQWSLSPLFLALPSHPHIQVSKTIVLLNEEVRVLRLKHIEADTRADQLLADKESLLRRPLTDPPSPSLCCCPALAPAPHPHPQVSEKIVLLDEEVRVLRLKHIEADTRADQLLADKESLLRLQDELRGEVQEKISLMEEFEDKFSRQFRCVGRGVWGRGGVVTRCCLASSLGGCERGG